jgi:hypothetical protein
MRYLFALLLLSVLIVSACGDGDTTGTRIRVQNELDNELRDLSWSFNFGTDEGTDDRLRPGRSTNYKRFDGAEQCGFQLEALLVGTGTITGGFSSCGMPAPIPEGAYTLVVRRPTSGTSEFETVLRED